MPPVLAVAAAHSPLRVEAQRQCPDPARGRRRVLPPCPRPVRLRRVGLVGHELAAEPGARARSASAAAARRGRPVAVACRLWETGWAVRRDGTGEERHLHTGVEWGDGNAGLRNVQGHHEAEARRGVSLEEPASLELG